MSIRQIEKVHALQRFLTSGEAKVLTTLAGYADDAGGSIYPGKARLVEEVGLSRRYVNLILGRFKSRGWLRYERPHARNVRAGMRLELPDPGSLIPQLSLPFEAVENLSISCGKPVEFSLSQIGIGISRSGIRDLLIPAPAVENAPTSDEQRSSGTSENPDPSFDPSLTKNEEEEAPLRVARPPENLSDPEPRIPNPKAFLRQLKAQLDTPDPARRRRSRR